MHFEAFDDKWNLFWDDVIENIIIFEFFTYHLMTPESNST